EVAIEIAEAVRDALLEGDLAPAVNLPTVPPEDRRKTDAVLELARGLGRLLGELTDGPTEEIVVRGTGPRGAQADLAVSAALEGFLSSRLAGPLNLINAVLLAEERGIEISRSRVRREGRGADWIELTARSGESHTSVAGKLTSREEPRLLRVDRFRVEVTPRGRLLFVRNDDVPGVIGSLGTILGGAGVNIGEFHQARDRDDGQALGVISLDGALSADHLAALRELPGVRDVRQVELGTRREG
ncbi:MAG: ACT domain-containing protein, partial [Gemmatimonadota bacterium]